jgi:hypothetical protein
LGERGGGAGEVTGHRISTLCGFRVPYSFLFTLVVRADRMTVVMSTAPTIESRLVSLEREMVELRRRLNRASGSGNWLQKIVSSQEADPDFKEVLELGHQARTADRPQDNNGE